LADADFYNDGNPAEVAKTLKRRAGLADSIEELEGHWLAVSSSIEALG
jgi:hypothetical protein